MADFIAESEVTFAIVLRFLDESVDTVSGRRACAHADKSNSPFNPCADKPSSSAPFGAKVQFDCVSE